MLPLSGLCISGCTKCIFTHKLVFTALNDKLDPNTHCEQEKVSIVNGNLSPKYHHNRIMLLLNIAGLMFCLKATGDASIQLHDIRGGKKSH